MKQNLIPLFQRPYCWSDKNWKSLWDDVNDMYESNDDKTHFLGAIVSTPFRTVPVGVNKHLIIDGQQRLLTTSIFLCAIRDFVDDKKRALIDDYLTNRHYDDPDNAKILPTNQDRHSYLQLIKRQEIIEDNSQIKKCYDYFSKHIKSKMEEDISFSEKVLQIVFNNLEVVMINLKDSDDPYLIFESLNHKGEPLKQGDLIRNFVLMKYKHSVEDNGEQYNIYNSLWLPMEGLLYNAHEKKSLSEDFFYHYSRRNGIDVRKKAVYSSYRDYFSTFPTTSDITQAIKSMKMMADYYNRFEIPQNETNQDFKEAFFNFKSLNKTVIYPLLMKLFEERDKKSINNEDLIKIFKVLESYIIRREICNVSSNYLKNSFLELCKNFPADNSYIWLKQTLETNTGNLRWPKDEETKKAIISNNFYSTPKIRLSPGL